MSERLSPRLSAIVDALPLAKGLRVLEIGCGPGEAAREVARRVGTGHVMGIDRSPAAITSAVAGSEPLLAAGVLSFRQVAIEEFVLDPTDVPFDLAYAARVGALDGRRPEIETEALRRIAAALTPTGRLFVDTGDPLREIDLP